MAFREAEPGDPRDAMERLFRETGAAEPLRGEAVLVKPNWLSRPERGVTTSPAVLDAVVEAVRSVASEVVVGETESGGRSFGHVAEAVEVEAELRNLSLSERRRVDAAGVELELPVEALEMAVVDVPVLKTHVLTGVTAGVKNLYGLLPGEEKERHHHEVDAVLEALYRAVDPEWTLLDGCWVMRSGGPRRGDVVRAGFVAASRDAAALDAAACRAAGVDPEEVPHLRRLGPEPDPRGAGAVDVELDPPELGWKQAVAAQVQRFGPTRRAVRLLRDLV